MVPLQYIIHSSHLGAALSTGCSWVQTTDVPAEDLLAMCHEGGAYLVLTDAVEACKAMAADGVVLTTEKILQLAIATPDPSGIVLQRPLPVTLALASARHTLGEDTPQMIGVQVTSEADAIAAAKAGADFIQVPKSEATALLAAVRQRSFTTPIVALGVADVDETLTFLDAGVSGIACTMDDVPPILIPSLLNADE